MYVYIFVCLLINEYKNTTISNQELWRETHEEEIQTKIKRTKEN
jgi:hypothetical protein